MKTFKMRIAAFAIAALFASAIPAVAQVVVETCGSPATPLTVGPGPASLYVDVNGNLCTDVAVTIGDANIVKWGGVDVGAMANYGTSPGAVKVPGVNAFVTNTITNQVNGLSFTNITTATDTVIKASAGVFSGLIVNTAGVGSAVTVYNNTTCTGAKIGTFSTATQGAIAPINAAAGVGICATTAGGTPADITVLWR